MKGNLKNVIFGGLGILCCPGLAWYLLWIPVKSSKIPLNPVKSPKICEKTPKSCEILSEIHEICKIPKIQRCSTMLENDFRTGYRCTLQNLGNLQNLQNLQNPAQSAPGSENPRLTGKIHGYLAVTRRTQGYPVVSCVLSPGGRFRFSNFLVDVNYSQGTAIRSVWFGDSAMLLTGAQLLKILHSAS